MMSFDAPDGYIILRVFYVQLKPLYWVDLWNLMQSNRTALALIHFLIFSKFSSMLISEVTVGAGGGTLHYI